MIPLAIGLAGFAAIIAGATMVVLWNRTDPRGAMARLSTVSEEHRRGS